MGEWMCDCSYNDPHTRQVRIYLPTDTGEEKNKKKAQLQIQINHLGA